MLEKVLLMSMPMKETLSIFQYDDDDDDDGRGSSSKNISFVYHVRVLSLSLLLPSSKVRYYKAARLRPRTTSSS